MRETAFRAASRKHRENGLPSWQLAVSGASTDSAERIHTIDCLIPKRGASNFANPINNWAAREYWLQIQKMGMAKYARNMSFSS